MQQLHMFSSNTQPDIHTINSPKVITKQLKENRTSEGKRRIRLSSNFLEVMGLPAGSRIKQESLGFDKGMRLSFDPKGDAKVYQRQYKSRKSNPFESQIDIQNQTLINDTFPSYISNFHFTIERGVIHIKGLENQVFSIIRNLKKSDDKFKTVMAMSSGIDMHCAESVGFNIDGLLEYRPQEKRDKSDFTETGVVNALFNSSPSWIINEDISKVDMKQVEQFTSKSGQTSFFHISLQCDDFSNAKAASLKHRDEENLDGTTDLVYDALRMIETIKPASILLENVSGFGKSELGRMMRAKLRKWGYFVSFQDMDAREFGGITSRKRYYMVASVFPDFEFPSQSNIERDVWGELKGMLGDCRDVTHSKALWDGIKTNRARIITEGKTYAPTVLKSQNRQAKDSIYIEHEGRYLFPSEEVLRHLCGFPETINLNGVSKTLASEIIGQSIDYPMHHKICKSVANHIKLNVEDSKVNVLRMGNVGQIQMERRVG